MDIAKAFRFFAAKLAMVTKDEKPGGSGCLANKKAAVVEGNHGGALRNDAAARRGG
jgi:hypothetical protein